MIAFVENLENTNWHLSSHSIGRTHPHRLGTVLENTTDTEIWSHTLTRYCMASYTWLVWPACFGLPIMYCGYYAREDKIVSGGRRREMWWEMMWCASMSGRVGVLLDEPKQILARLSWKEQVKANWAKPNGSQIRKGSTVNYTSSGKKNDCILNFSLPCHYFYSWNNAHALVLVEETVFLFSWFNTMQ